MAIAFTKYVDIVSGVGGAVVAQARELIGRIFTSNPLAPTKTVIEFTTLEEVGQYFGFTSEEYLRAQFYFGFVSKIQTTPRKISFAHWASADSAPLIFGQSKTFAVADFTGINDGAFSLTLGGDTEIITGIDFTGDASLADVAATIEAAIQAANPAAVWTGATVAYDAPGSQFNFTGGAVGNFAISVTNAGSGTEIADLVGWLTGAIFSDGVVAESITEVLTESTSATNNFGSFLFMPAFSIDDVVEAATWNNAQNVRFMYCARVLAADTTAYFAALQNISGTALTLYDGSIAEYDEMVPMNILAATDYSRRNAVQNYMYQQAQLTAKVSDTGLSNTYDDERVNYYGETQQAGQNISFYQRGFMMGQSTDPVDMGVYSNEIWLKDAAGVEIINLQLALNFIPANDDGRSDVLGVLEAEGGPIQTALLNGTISVGKDLNPTQIAFITQVTGDEFAYIQIQTNGYWLDAVIDEPQPNEFVIKYTLLYSKNDVVRKVEGTHTLI